MTCLYMACCQTQDVWEVQQTGTRRCMMVCSSDTDPDLHVQRSSGQVAVMQGTCGRSTRQHSCSTAASSSACTAAERSWVTVLGVLPQKAQARGTTGSHQPAQCSAGQHSVGARHRARERSACQHSCSTAANSSECTLSAFRHAEGTRMFLNRGVPHSRCV